MPDSARAGRSAIWPAGHYTLEVVALEFPDAPEPLPGSWGPRVVGEADAYFREISGGVVRWGVGAVRRVRLRRPSASFHLRRRLLADRVRFWGAVLARLAQVSGDALLVVVPEAAKVRGCFSLGHRWNSPRLAEALAPLGEALIRGAVVRSSTGWGTLAHELGHVLGLPDLYDYWLARRSADIGTSRFVGAWDLMGRGSDGADGARPHPMAWTKSLAGWGTHVEWSPDQTRYVLGEDASAVRVPLPGAAALFVEARVRAGFDAVLPAEGVLLSVADERHPEGRGPLRVISPARPADPEREERFGPHWSAPLRPGERCEHRGYVIHVDRQEDRTFTVDITRH